MNKTIIQVFLIVGILVVIFLAWQLIFNKGGILKTGYNTLANGVNKQWQKVGGKDSKIPAEWTDENAQDNGAGFDLNTGAGGAVGTGQTN